MSRLESMSPPTIEGNGQGPMVKAARTPLAVALTLALRCSRAIREYQAPTVAPSLNSRVFATALAPIAP